MVKNKTVLYDIIGVDKTASLTEIKKAYRIRALELHPDKNAGKSDSKAGFQELQKAYEILRDETRRKEYDRTGNIDEEDDELDFAAAAGRFEKRIDPAEIAKFEKCYRRSKEEREDLKEFYDKYEQQGLCCALLASRMKYDVEELWED
eukprot:GHVU01129126.1.p2 GENE.GHVU01129126.1~~GHVU01129126.1.p2  ORF type:complete len:148 (-),score=30.77 GHVU01129126.1:1924-2367(-)